MSAKDRSKSDLSVHAISVSTCNLNNIIVYESNDEARIRVSCLLWDMAIQPTNYANALTVPVSRDILSPHKTIREDELIYLPGWNQLL